MKAFLLALILSVASAPAAISPAWAVNPDEVLPDPRMEERAREISKDLRCLVCQNQSIDDSNAPLARDLRVVVRDRLKAGDSNDQVMAYVTDRYGDYVLLRPPFKATTLALWIGPFVVLAAGVALLLRRLGNRTPEAELSEEESRRLQKLADSERR